MFKNVSSEGGLPGGRSLATSAGLRTSSTGLAAQESSWLSLLSVLSRPALSFVSKYLPGLGGGGGATSGSKWQPSGARVDVAQDQEELCASTWSWLSDSEQSLRQLGIEPGQNSEASSSGTFFAWDAQSSCKDWMRGRWGGLWGGDPLSFDLSHTDLRSVHEGFCAPQSSKLTKEQCRILVSGNLCSESAGATVHKEEALVNAGPDGVQNCGEVATDQDNGYYSLEEEHGLKCHTCRSAGALCKAHVKQTDAAGHTILDRLPDRMADKIEVGRVSEECPPDEMMAECHTTADEIGLGHTCQSAAAPCDVHVKPTNWTDSQGDVTEDNPPDDATVDKMEASHVTRMAVPQCRNVGIAFIMGCPCSDDDSHSDTDSAHDDGFDSSGSSDLSSDWSSSDEDEEGGGDEETARLLASLCRHDDPYNPQHFSARLHTGCAAPRPVPVATTANVSPSLLPLGQDAWDDSGGEADDPESLLLLASLTPSDPYSLLNFQAPLSTGKAQSTPPRATELPAADRMDGGFTRPFTSAKKVRFSDVVEEFFIASGTDAAEKEDRRGPWEEVARDRGRFLRRCQEAELTLAYCLQPEHRRRAYCRINGHEAD
ncbi:protein phosphatase 1 regulatory subunit 15B [Hippocampus comes]|uniref:protein phosphatase 1 regulatory subunit 15B n=1 Tax=Hippocampus comes TaxID=109280 RepID=UPI00094F1DA5|nr:PREDICTED: protein phosphatase 1 regulatory subunit 15B-like [Hippocampus comes]